MGGNVSIKGQNAQHLDLKVTNRTEIVPVLHELLISINIAFTKKFKTPLWNAQLLKNKAFLSGSSLHFFNLKDIPTDTFVSKKPTVGDMDTMVDRKREQQLGQFLTAAEGKTIGPGTLVGFKPGNEQLISLWELQNPPIKVQIDFEFVDFKNGNPTEWAKFSHSSAWQDIEHGVKGVFHKYLIQALTRLSSKEFYLRKNTGRGKAKLETDVLTKDNMYSFAVASKEGGGLRAKYEPVLDGNGRPLHKDGLSVMRAAPTTGYQQDVGKIFKTILGKRKIPKDADFWSFTGLVSLMNSVLSPEEKKAVLEGFIEKTIGEQAQGLYRNDPDRDIEEKSKAIKYLIKALAVKPKNLTKLMKAYHTNYKMTDDGDESTDIVKSMAKSALKEAAPSYKRKGIPHIYNPGSSVEMKDEEFIQFCQAIMKDGGYLKGAQINLKVDGAGIRFGRDEQGRPFFMTSSVDEPQYAENYGIFQKYTATKTQDPERLEFAKKYDDALKIITNAEFMKAVPKDTIVQSEMLYMPLGKQSEKGIAFVNIPYDPKKLGKVLTLIIIDVKKYSTGQKSPYSSKVIAGLEQHSNPDIKIISNTLSSPGIDEIPELAAPIAKNASKLLNAIKSKGEGAEKAKEILSHARQNISQVIFNTPVLTGKNMLGPNIEGLVINLPNGQVAKVTSKEMKDAVASKKKPTNDSKRHKPAVVTVGSFVGHKGHQQLINQTIETAKKVGGDPFIYVSPVVGPDDPIPPKVKVATLQKLYPDYAKNIQVWRPDGTPMKKIEKELVLPSNSPYNKIILLVGEDRAEGFKDWMNALEKRMKDPDAVAKYGGTQNQVDFETISTPRGTGISFTQLRNALRNMSDKAAITNLWFKAFDTETLGEDWVKKLMAITHKGIKQEIKERIEAIKPLLETASIEQKNTFLYILERAKEQLAQAENITENIDDSADYLDEK